MSLTDAIALAASDRDLAAIAADLMRLETGVSLTATQIARITGLSKRTVLRRLGAAKVKALPSGGGDPRYSANDVRRVWGIR